MSDNKKPIGFARALSELHATSNFLDPESIIEISRGSTSYKTTLLELDRSIIDNFPLFTILNSIFDSENYPSDTYFEGQSDKITKFCNNPYVKKENDPDEENIGKLYESLSTSNLVTKTATDEYMNSVGICVPIHTPSAKYYYYSADDKKWVNDELRRPYVMSSTRDGIWTSKSKLKFNYGHNLYSYTDEVMAKKNMMLDVTGNIVLDETYQNTWFEKNQYSFVGLTINGKIITLVFLKNILKLKLKNGKYQTVAQFHFHCPIASGTKFRIVTNAQCKLFGISEKDQPMRKLYDSLNAVNLGFYDYGKM